MPTDLTRREMLALGVPAALLGTGAFASAQQMEPGSRRHPHAAADAPAVAKLFAEAYGGGEYKLPALPYAYDALEPHIDAQTMRLHHDAHHQAYVNGLNKAVEQMKDAADLEASAIEALQRAVSFNGGGHMLHTLFWGTMGPNAGGEPDGEIARAIGDSFGGFDSFKAYFSKVAGGIKGSGWAILAYEPIGDRLMVYALGDQDLRHIAGTVPILGVDVWEHAYYLKYQNKRADYVKAWWNVVNWTAVNEMYAAHRMGHGRGGPHHAH